MRVLFTVIIFRRFVGPELITLDQAQYFHDRGFDVDVFTLEKDGPLSEHIPSYIRVIDLSEVDDLHSHYDLIVSRQWPLLEYLLFARRIDADRVYFESISWRLPIDFYPYFYSDLTMCGYVSKRIKNKLDDMGYDTNGSYYFPNYTTRAFLEYEKSDSGDDARRAYGRLNKIAVVSNHPPHELEEAADILRSQYAVDVDIYGMHHEYRLITPDILAQYDAIATIGKTAFFSLSMGIPTYLYDETCSIGYVTTANYQSCLDGNMAGSDGYCRKDPQRIADEVWSGFSGASEQANELKKCARRDFCYFSPRFSLTKSILTNGISCDGIGLLSKLERA